MFIDINRTNVNRRRIAIKINFERPDFSKIKNNNNNKKLSEYHKTKPYTSPPPKLKSEKY
jgi:hypothetical protein